MIVMKRDSFAKKTGRPRAFDESAALDKAMLTFWRHGYEGTALSLLSAEMGMNAPSIYAAFGDKKGLFLKALDRYVGDLDEIKLFVNGAGSAREAAYEMLKASVLRFTSPQNPKGCMLASATASCSAAALDVQEVAARKRAAIEKILYDRIQRDIAEGSLPKATSASSLAALTLITIQGLSVLARDGSTRKKLLAVVETAMVAWPA
jgi:AcrR family transcriptional regulator